MVWLHVKKIKFYIKIEILINFYILVLSLIFGSKNKREDSYSRKNLLKNKIQIGRSRIYLKVGSILNEKVD